MFTLVLDVPGGNALELTPRTSSVQFTTLAVGGFGSFTCTLEAIKRPQDIPYLSTIRCLYGSMILWEGRVEDKSWDPLTRSLSIQAFGWSRALSDTSVRRIWSQRSLDMRDITYATSTDITYHPELYSLTADGAGIGNYDPTDLTKYGVKIIGVTGTGQQDNGHVVEVVAPSGLTYARMMFDGSVVTTSPPFGSKLVVYDSTNRTSWTSELSVSSNTTNSPQSVALQSGAKYIRFGLRNNTTNETVNSTVYVEIRNIRLLGTSVVEDSSALGGGGFYGGTLLRDLIALVPGLTLGDIDTGSDFAIESIERSVRGYARGVVDEIASYYSREWTIWENGRFDWKAVNLDEPNLVIPVTDWENGSVSGSIDDIYETAYVLYSDAATGAETESSVASTDQRNPFVRSAAGRDLILSAGVPMTTNTSTQLATRLAAERGSFVPGRGTIVIAANKIVSTMFGSIPAFAIRAGQNVYVPDLPSDLITIRQDGISLFHVSSCTVDMHRNRVTLELDTLQRSTDVLLARLASVTRSLTG